MHELTQTSVQRLVLGNALQESTPFRFHLINTFALGDVAGQKQACRLAGPGDGTQRKFHIEASAVLPMVPGLVRQVGGGDPLAVALSINVGSALVDVSPLSTIGALCVAAVADRAAGRDLFNKLLAFGLTMIVVGALLCAFLAGPFARM